MSYRFDPRRPLPEEIRRVAEERIAHASSQLGREGEAVHEGVHEARKDFKKLRALFRLVRGELGDDHRSLQRQARDMGRRLSAAGPGRPSGRARPKPTTSGASG